MADKSASKAPEIKLRLGLPEDYEAVLALGDMMEGRDYLPAKYHDYVKDPNRGINLFDLDGKVVSVM